jgi:hypothetical protein
LDEIDLAAVHPALLVDYADIGSLHLADAAIGRGRTAQPWPLDHATEFLINKGHDLSGPAIIIKFPSWDRDGLEFVPTPLADLTPRADDRSAAG